MQKKLWRYGFGVLNHHRHIDSLLRLLLFRVVPWWCHRSEKGHKWMHNSNSFPKKRWTKFNDIAEKRRKRKLRNSKRWLIHHRAHLFIHKNLLLTSWIHMSRVTYFSFLSRQINCLHNLHVVQRWQASDLHIIIIISMCVHGKVNIYCITELLTLCVMTGFIFLSHIFLFKTY